MWRYFSPAGTVTFGFALCACCPSVRAQAEQDRTPIPMRIELVLDNPTCTVHKNFTFNVRIVNPNDFPVIIPGVNLDYYVEPKIYLLRDDEQDLLLRYQATVSALTRIPITIRAGQALEKHRFLWLDNLGALWWPDDPGVYRLQAQFNTQVRLEGVEEWHPVDWDRPIVELRVQSPNLLDRQASNWLRGRLEEQQRRKTVPGIPRDVTLERIRIYAEFLERFPDSTYAPAIRWETVKLLLGHESTLKEEPVMVDLFDECLTFCLEQGGAYAQEFVTWDADGNGSDVCELAFMHGRGALFKRLVEEIDRRYPDELKDILYRRVIVAGLTESIEETDKIAQSLKDRFPNSRYARDLPRLLRQIKKQRKAYPTPE